MQKLPSVAGTELPKAAANHAQAAVDMSALSHSMPQTSHMAGWLENDPLPDHGIFRPHAAQQFISKPEFFQLGLI